MRLYESHSDLPDTARGAAVALGNFDGVHRGHAAVIGLAGAAAQTSSAPLGVVTFEPHPRQIFQPTTHPFRLTPLSAKTRLIAELGVDLLYALPFDLAFSQITAEAFIHDVLVGALGVTHVVAGYDYEFGHKRVGNVALLERAAGDGLFGFTPAAAVHAEDGEVYSSTRIRTFLEAGSPERATELLGRPYAIEGVVLRGDRRGRSIGFPTANVDPGEYLRPAFGVYVVRVRLTDGRWFGGVANFGQRPTVDGFKLLLESHLFDCDEDLYGSEIRVELLHFIRTERKFDGLDALKAQIAADSESARAWLEA
ncbi:MAG: bifunctional riboflavin kinase/FAD synthetase [Alphaproteobacteria bacterium]|nr:bifunctional riboflavin kinase/FAD synthetase [Alphaproteobacteria bacterium]